MMLKIAQRTIWLRYCVEETIMAYQWTHWTNYGIKCTISERLSPSLIYLPQVMLQWVTSKEHFRRHIPRLICLENVSLDPLQNGFKMHDGALEPDTYSRPLTECMVINCNCVRCASSRFPCRKNGLPYCAFCKCQSNDQPYRKPE